jgi:hypothetical protein
MRSETGVIDNDAAFCQRIGYGRPYLWAPSSLVGLGARIRGDLDGSRLTAALQLARRKHPRLGTRVHLEPDRSAWLTTEGVPDIPLLIHRRESAHDWVGTYLEQTQIPFPITTGPLVRFILLQDDEGADLVMLCHHLVMDGHSALYLFHELLSFANDPGQEVLPETGLPLVTWENLPAEASRDLPLHVLAGALNRYWRARQVAIDEEDYLRIHRRYWQEKHGFAAWGLTQEATVDLCAQCKARGVSVTGAICAAFLLAQREAEAGRPVDLDKVSMSVDIRQRMLRSPGRDVGLYAGAIVSEFSPAAGLTFWERARACQEQFRRDVQDNRKLFQPLLFSELAPSFLDALGLGLFDTFHSHQVDLLLRALGMRGRQRGMDISNLGRADAVEEGGSCRLETFFTIPPLIPGVEKTLSLVTAGGVMNLTLVWRECDIDSDTVEQVRRLALGHLTKALGWSSAEGACAHSTLRAT